MDARIVADAASVLPLAPRNASIVKEGYVGAIFFFDSRILIGLLVRCKVVEERQPVIEKPEVVVFNFQRA
jgi:hypothetical protein